MSNPPVIVVSDPPDMPKIPKQETSKVLIVEPKEKLTSIQEGTIKKGGQNVRPTTERPPPPKGQGGSVKMEDVPVWFGPATIRSMKNNFLAHIKGCDKCRASQEPDEVCPEGAEFVDALGMDRQEKPPERPASLVKRSAKAKADRVKWINKKTEDLERTLDKIEGGILDFEGRRSNAVADKETIVRKCEQDNADLWSRIESIKKKILSADGMIDMWKKDIERLNGAVAESVEANVERFRSIGMAEDTIRSIENEQKRAQSDLELAGEPFDPKLVALRKERQKVFRRLESHNRNNPE